MDFLLNIKKYFYKTALYTAKSAEEKSSADLIYL